MASLHQISKFYRSFSGTDTLAFILLPGSKPVVLGALTTISYSMFRNKKPVINIGRTNINGVTRGSRIFAGTMIFTVINQHWLREVQTELPWLANIKELKVDELPLFDVMIVSANEYGSSVSMYIYGIDFTDEAQTISVEDLFTENTFSFVARDISTFQSHNTVHQVVGGSSANVIDKDTSPRFYILHSTTNVDDVIKLDQKLYEAELKFNSDSGTRRYESDWNRELYYSPSLENLMMGNDVLNVQHLLAEQNDRYYISSDTLGVYTDVTASAVRYYQATHGLEPTGRVDQRTYIALVNEVQENKDKKYAMCTNKNGAYIYPTADKSYSVIGLPYVPYGNSIEYIGVTLGADGDNYYQTTEGYIAFNDMHSPETSSSTVEFPTLKYGDYGNYVVMLQSCLRAVYPDFVNYTSGYFDTLTKQYVMKFKLEHGMPTDDELVTYDFWMALRAIDNETFREVSQDGFFIETSKHPGGYSLLSNGILNDLSDFNIKMYSNSTVPVKISAVMNYDDGKSITKSSTIDVQTPIEFSFKQFKSCFTYNPEHGNPSLVEVFIYPYNKQAYKWNLKYSTDSGVTV